MLLGLVQDALGQGSRSAVDHTAVARRRYSGGMVTGQNVADVVVADVVVADVVVADVDNDMT